MNDPTWHNVHASKDVETLFYGRAPRGRTPLGERLRPLLSGQCFRRADLPETGRGDAAAGTWIPRLGRGYSVETSTAAAGTLAVETGARLRWHPKGHSSETDLILLIMTDGEPSDITFDNLKNMVAAKKGNVYVTFMMCGGRVETS